MLTIQRTIYRHAQFFFIEGRFNMLLDGNKEYLVTRAVKSVNHPSKSF